ncbi:hypothetical protein SARC_13301, partial [Sphaeroforma arctica JP610]
EDLIISELLTQIAVDIVAGADGKPDSFTDIFRDDWEWYIISNFDDQTYTPERVEKPGFNGSIIGMSSEPSAEKSGAGFTGWKVQAMRGCEVIEGSHKDTANPCRDDKEGFIRIPSDFYLIEDDSLRGPAEDFADDHELFTEEFAKTFNHVLHLGIDRCGGDDGDNKRDGEEVCMISNENTDQGVCVISDGVPDNSSDRVSDDSSDRVSDDSSGRVSDDLFDEVSDSCEDIKTIAKLVYTFSQEEIGTGCSNIQNVLVHAGGGAVDLPRDCRDGYRRTLLEKSGSVRYKRT